jgi:DNA ligase-1
MLASPADLDSLRFPLYASPKLDGIRAMVTDAGLVSRKLLPIPNRHLQLALSTDFLRGLDGELILGNPTDEDVYRRTNSSVMSRDGEPSVTFYVLDHFGRPAME